MTSTFYDIERSTTTPRSTEMYAMQEALARDRMREREQQARQSRLPAELAAANRWHYLAERARVAASRHSHRAVQAAVVN
jgi:hypothetical protein